MEWKTIFGHRQQDYRTWPSVVQAESQVFRFPVNSRGVGLRFYFSNEFGMEPLIFLAVHLKVERNGRVLMQRQITKHKAAKIVVRPREELISDPVHGSIEPGDTLVIATRLAVPTVITSGTVTYSRRELTVCNYLEGQKIPQQEQFRMVRENPRMLMVYGIADVQCLQAEGAKTIVAFGDSIIQQGFLVDGIKARLKAAGYQNISLINRGIGGSRVLAATDHREDEFYRHGDAGIIRFETDVFSRDIPDKVVIFHGINDLIHQRRYPKRDRIKVEDVIEGLKKYTDIIKLYGSEAIGFTLTPLGRSVFYSHSLEQKRQQINEWIRHTAVFDMVVDLDEMLRSQQDAGVLIEAADAGDGLHLSAKGGEMIAERIDLARFTGYSFSTSAAPS